MPTLAVVDFNIVCATLGGFIALFGLVSYLLKEKFYLSEALISLVAGVIFSPHAANLVRPLDYALDNTEVLGTITLYFTRLVLGVQLVIAGVQLPSKYLAKEWRSLSLLLGPGMVAMWLCTSLIIWAMVPNLSFLHSLAVGACVTPTDPVLSNTIVKGKFADKNIPKELQKIITAESGTNDGLGYPFLFLPLFLIRYNEGGYHQAGTAVGMWFYETWIYQIVLSVVYGAVVGWIAKELLHWAEEKKYIDRESFIVFAIALALFIVGTCGMFGSDDILACFIAGNVFTWDDWFRKETLDDSLQPTIDMLLNVTIFIWFGAVCPWVKFRHNSVIPIYRLIFLGILVLLLRRPPIVYAMHKKIHQIEGKKHAIFVGFFGPIGVSAIFYLYITLEYLRTIKDVEGNQREDILKLEEIVTIVVWFLVICSIVVHGVSIPLGKLGLYLPRTLSQALSQDSDQDNNLALQTPSSSGFFRPANRHNEPGQYGITIPGAVYRVGRSVVKGNSRNTSKRTSKAPSPRDSSPTENGMRGETMERSGSVNHEMHNKGMLGVVQPGNPVGRDIRFVDEVPRNVIKKEEPEVL
ncbi:hypothetical protein EJ08DRAFT_648259 [Tothia fuscella]|uniref:Cation/H+ exchanger transmembrane domain-containing protein n=1 Tax=Tothia fuscella TaxID=1048955 RepID=A0A9P4NUW8_9PEZI|nr:hypothetical protein EJ08DRAFT_648259 [Tothia fuscella]